VGKPLRILLVEDSEDDAALLLRTLRHEGYEIVYEIVDTPSAMRAALESQDWDVITSDHAMPQFSAPAALALAKELSPSLPFIILSGELDINLAVSLMKEGAQDFIQKRELVRIVPAIERALKEAESIIKRKQAEQALRESEALYRTFINASSDMVFLKDELFRNIVVNQSMAAFFGKPEGEVIGKSDFELMPQMAAEKCRDTDLEALASTSVITTEEIVGDQVYETLKFPVDLGSNRTGVGGFIRDITARKQAAEKELANERKYRTVADNTYDWEYWLDPQYRFIYCSPSCERITGYKVEEFLADPDLLLRIIHPKHQRDFVLHKESACQTFHTGEIEFLLMRSDGTERWIGHTCQSIYDEHGVFMGIRGSNRDISERKAVEEKLAKSEEKYRALAENINDIIYEIDHQGVITYISPAAKDILEYDPDDLIGKNFSEIIHREDWSLFANRFLQLRDGIEDPSDYRVISKSGGIIWVRTRTKTITEKGRFMGARGTLIDITERKRAEDDLQVSEERFRLLSEAAFEAIAIHEEGVLLSANEQYFKMFGYEPGEALGKEMISITIAPEAIELAKKQIATDGLGPYESIGLRKDGTRFPMEIRVRKMNYKGRNVRFGAIRDITDRK